MGHEMRFKYLLIEILLLITCVAVSGCSSLDVALDAHSGNEKYSLESEKGKTDNNLNYDFQVGIPKLVSSEKRMRPLYEIARLGYGYIGSYNFGIDYELVNYGNDLYSSFLDVVNNRNSLIQVLEYQSGTIYDENDLYFFSFVPVTTLVLNVTQTYFVAFGFGIPIFTSVGFNNEKYEPVSYSDTLYYALGIDRKFYDNNLSLFIKSYSQKVNAEQENSKKRISIKYDTYFLTLRYYL
jgi:hypothetical protein